MKILPEPNGSLYTSNVFSVFLLVVLFFALYLAYMVAEPFFHTLIIAAALSIIFSPIFLWILRRVGGRRGLASFLTVMSIFFLLLLPSILLTYGLVDQGRESVNAIKGWIRTTDFDTLLQGTHLEPALDWVEEHLPFLNIRQFNIQAEVVKLTTDFTQGLGSFGKELFKGTAQFLFHFVLMLVAVFYFLRDGNVMMERLKYLCPLRSKQEDVIIDSLKRVSRSVLLGSVSIAVLQGIAGGIGLAIAGIPAVFWGAMMAFAALIPVLGTGLIWVPACGYLLLQGQWGMALFLAIWCGVFVVGIDTLLRPVLLREASRVSAFYVFLAILGGLYAFGALGILYGPLILSFVMVMLEIYGEEYSHILSDKSARSAAAPEAVQDDGQG